MQPSRPAPDWPRQKVAEAWKHGIYLWINHKLFILYDFDKYLLQLFLVCLIKFRIAFVFAFCNAESTVPCTLINCEGDAFLVFLCLCLTESRIKNHFCLRTEEKTLHFA